MRLFFIQSEGFSDVINDKEAVSAEFGRGLAIVGQFSDSHDLVLA